MIFSIAPRRNIHLERRLIQGYKDFASYVNIRKDLLLMQRTNKSLNVGAVHTNVNIIQKYQRIIVSDLVMSQSGPSARAKQPESTSDRITICAN